MKPADTVAITMARKLADAGLSVRLYLWKGEWTVIAVMGERQVGFGFRVSSAELLTNPEAFADLHARRLSDALTPRDDSYEIKFIDMPEKAPRCPPCVCGHIQSMHEGNPLRCWLCECMGYRAAP